MWSTAKAIAAGDVVIIWLTRDVIQPLLITPGKEFNSKFGHYRHADLVGMPYGSKVGSRKGKGFIHVLRPTPELWTMALPHRTQILYLADIAFITSHLNIKPGSQVIEAVLNKPIVRYWIWVILAFRVPDSEFREEFTQHGMNDIVTLTHRNVCKDGFTVEDTVDSVFLDLPAPWEAVDHAKKALRKDRTTRICCFSPCMEQVLRTVNALNDAGFTDITMYETLLRPVDVSHVPALQSIGEISEKLKQAERKREDKRLQQIAAGRQQSASKRKREDGTPVKDQPEQASEAGTAAGERKRLKTDEDASPVVPEPAQEMELDDREESGEATAGTTTLVPAGPPVQITPAKISLSKVMSEVRGHTSYLTFAILQPFSTPLETEPSTAAVTPAATD